MNTLPYDFNVFGFRNYHVDAKKTNGTVQNYAVQWCLTPKTTTSNFEEPVSACKWDYINFISRKLANANVSLMCYRNVGS